MEEERAPADARPAAPVPEAPDSLAAIVPKRRLWPVFAVLAAVVALAGFFVYRAVTATDPLRILIAIDLDGYWWEGSEPAAKLADALAAQLGELGFDPVKGGDPRTMKVLEKAKDPEAAARKLGAGFVVQARLAPEVVEHPIKGGYYEIRVDAPVTLTFVDKGTTSEARIRGYAYSTKKEGAMAYLAESMASQALDVVIAQLLDHPAVVEITGGSDVKLLSRINPAIVFGKVRAMKLKEAAEAYARPAKEAEAQAKGRVTFHSDAAADDELVGVGQGGYFVKTADVTPFFSFRRRELGRTEALETVTFRPLDVSPGADPAALKVLWKGYHVFTYPSADREGDRVALVEDLFGWAKTITMVDRSGAGAGKRARIDPEHRFVDPKLAPGGRFVAVYDRPHQGAPADLLVVDAATGKDVFSFRSDNHTLGGFTWIDATHLAFSHTPSSPRGEGQNLVVVDVSTQPYSMERPYRLKPGQPGAMITPSASRDGKLLVWAESSSPPGLAVVDTATWSRRFFPVEDGATWPTFSPDGAHVVFETVGAGITDIGLLTVATGAVKKLVDTPLQERLPAFSADGKRVIFEVRSSDPVFPRARSISRIASVAFEP